MDFGILSRLDVKFYDNALVCVSAVVNQELERLIHQWDFPMGFYDSFFFFPIYN